MIGKFFLAHPAGRWVTIRVHRFIHPQLRQPLQFAQFGCPICKMAWRTLDKQMRVRMEDSLADQSKIEFAPREPGKAAIQMSATAKRQLDAILAERPELEEEFTKAMEEIRTQYGDGDRT